MIPPLNVERDPLEPGLFRDDELVYAAFARCPCGAGIAHWTKAAPFGDTAFWDCSDILTGRATPKSQEGSVQHTARLPFAFYEIKSERQPSARGASTRPH